MNDWWAISAEAFMEALKRCHAGEDPSMVYAEYYVNSDHEECTCDHEDEHEH